MTEKELDQLLDTIEQKNLVLPPAQIASARGRVKAGFKELQRMSKINENLAMIREAKESGNEDDVISLGTLIDVCNKRIKKLGGVNG